MCIRDSRYSPLALELTKLLYNGPVRACVLIHYPADLPGNQYVCAICFKLNNVAQRA